MDYVIGKRNLTMSNNKIITIIFPNVGGKVQYRNLTEKYHKNVLGNLHDASYQSILPTVVRDMQEWSFEQLWDVVEKCENTFGFEDREVVTYAVHKVYKKYLEETENVLEE